MSFWSWFFNNNNNDDPNDRNNSNPNENNNNPNNDSSEEPGVMSTVLSAALAMAWELAKHFTYEVMIAGGTYLVSRSIISWLREANPNMTDEQSDRLYSLINRAVKDYRNGQDVSYSLLAILSVILPPDQDLEDIYESILTTGTYSFTHSPSAPTLSPEDLTKRQIPEDVEFTKKKPADEASTILVEQYGLEEARVLLIPIELRQVLLDVLKTKPQCPMSLDDIVDPDTGKVRPDVTAVFQYVNARPHVFLYDTEVLSEWLQTGNQQNPVTRQVIRQKESFVLTPPA